MPNFNTAKAKVAFFDVSKTANVENLFKPLSKESFDKLNKAVTYAFERAYGSNTSVTMVVFLSTEYYFRASDMKKVITNIEDENAKIVTSMADLLVVKTEDDNIITIRFVGGSNFTPKGIDRMEITDGSGVSAVGLTQELFNIRNIN